MRRIANILCFAAMATACSVAAMAEDYSLDAYVQKVSRDNPDLALSRQSVANAVQNKNYARAALLPTVAATGSYTRNMKDIMAPAAAYTVPAEAALYGGAAPIHYQDVDQNKDNEVTYGIAVQFNLLAPTDLARFRQAQKNVSIQKDVDEFTRRSVLTAAKKLYAQTQLTSELVAVSRLSEKSSGEAYRIVEKKYNAGTATELDLRLAEVDWKTDIAAIATAEKNANAAMMALKTLAGIPLDETVKLTDEEDSIPDLRETPDLTAVLAARGDYRAQRTAREIADIAYKASIGTFLPTVSTSFAAIHGGQGDGSSWTDYEYDATQLTFSLTFPLFTGGSRVALVQMAKIQQTQANIQIQQAEDKIRQNIETLDLTLSEAKTRLETAQAVENAAIRAASLAQKSMESGLGTQLSASQANTKLAGARLNLRNAIYDYRAAYYDWELASGLGDWK